MPKKKENYQVKSWTSSRTIWLNVVGLAVVIAEALTKNITGLPEWLTAVLSIVVFAGNVALRFDTKDAIK